MQVVVDWDGTATVRDSLVEVVERFGDRSLALRADEGLRSGALTLHECMELEFAGVRAELDEVVRWLEHVRLRPGFRAFAERYDPIILSSGFVETIEPILERDGLSLRVVANSVDVRRGVWRVRWRDDHACQACGEPCKRRALPRGNVVYVGDGWSDRCAARAASRVFARDGLADFLAAAGVPFERFDDFRDLPALLG